MNFNSIFVGNLAWSITDDDLRNFAEVAGDVIEATISRHEDTKRSKGWGIVRYASAEAAQRAVKDLEGCPLAGRKCHVRIDRTLTDIPFAMYVGNIPWSTTEEELMELFSAFSPATSHVLTNMYGRSRGFAIIKFYEEDHMNAAIEALNGATLQDRVIECRPDRGPGRSEEYSNDLTDVFVGRLNPMINEDALRVIFARFGGITSVSIARYADGNSRGWGLVKFENSHEAHAAVNAMNNAFIADNPSPLKVKFDRGMRK